MKKYTAFLIGFIIVTMGCALNLFDDQIISPTASPTMITTPEVSVTLETETVNLTGTAAADLTATRYAAPLSDYVTIGPSPTPSPTTRSTSPPSSGGDSSSFGTCKDTTGGRTKVRMDNNTGGTAYLTFTGPETRNCAIAPGLYIFYMKAGVYSISGTACGGYQYLGSHVINAVWKYTLNCG